MEPPVSVPLAAAVMPAATQAAEPPEEPPGLRSKLQGLAVGPKWLVSVEEPIANSSMFNLPKVTDPASSSRAMAVAV